MNTERRGRRPSAAGQSISQLPWSQPQLTLEPARHEARVGAISLGLTPTEFRLLEALVRAGGDLVAHHRLARAGRASVTEL